jgi:hypothetical protein
MRSVTGDRKLGRLKRDASPRELAYHSQPRLVPETNLIAIWSASEL